MDLHVLRVTESKKNHFGMSSVCLFVCQSVDTITQKLLIQLNKIISAGIAYEQNRPTGVASAPMAQSSFLAKSALKISCTKIYLRQKLLQMTIRNFWLKNGFDRPMGLASALIAQFGFLAKSAFKMSCTNFFLRQKLFKIKSCNFYIM